jgi:deazaflavin-dependent oxidoreductase (nitroreductase family)
MAESTSGGVPPWLNKMMTFILRSPLHHLVSKTTMLITFTGRKSGKRYTTPVSYVRENNAVTLFTHGKWWKNLIGGQSVTVRIQGQDLPGKAVPTVNDKEAIADNLYDFLQKVRRDAPYYGVTFDENGLPQRDEIARDVERVAMVKITL